MQIIKQITMKIKTIYSLGFRNLNVPISRKSIILLLFISTGKKFLIFYKVTNYSIHYATEWQIVSFFYTILSEKKISQIGVWYKDQARA